MPGGRLDPPLTLSLDEAALIAPVPLDNWTADMGGRNVKVDVQFQSRAQIRDRWGEVGAAAILNNAGTVLIFGGTKDPDDLNAWSTLCGERDEDVPTYDTDGQVTALGQRRVPVLSPSQIAQLPARRVVIIRRGMPPAIGRVQMAWKRHDVRSARREERRAVQGARLQVIATRVRARGRRLTGRRDAIDTNAATAAAIDATTTGGDLVEVDDPRGGASGPAVLDLRPDTDTDRRDPA